MIWEQELAKQEELKLQTLRNWRKKMDEGKHWVKEGGKKTARVMFTELGAEIIKSIKEEKLKRGDLRKPSPAEDEPKPHEPESILLYRFATNPRIVQGWLNGDKEKRVRVIVKPNWIKFFKERRTWFKARQLEGDLYTMFGVNQKDKI